MTEISHFKRPRRAGRGARRGPRSLAGRAPRHVAARGAGSQVGAWGGAGAHRLWSRLPHVAAHGAGRARKLEARRGRAGRGGAGRNGRGGEGRGRAERRGGWGSRAGRARILFLRESVSGSLRLRRVARGGRQGLWSAEPFGSLHPRTARCLEHPGQSPRPRRPHRNPCGFAPPPGAWRSGESARALPWGRRRLDLEPAASVRSREVWTQSSTAWGWLAD